MYKNGIDVSLQFNQSPQSKDQFKHIPQNLKKRGGFLTTQKNHCLYPYIRSIAVGAAPTKSSIQK